MDRRLFGLSLAAAMAAPFTARAEALVFLDYTQDALDKAYDQSVWASNERDMIARYASESADVRKKYPPKTERYGDSDAETLDIFAPADAKGLPVMAFIHGGAWRALGRDDASAPAPTFVENGCLYVALNFANLPHVRLPDMAAQCRRALIWLFKNVDRFGGDPTRIFVSGHSSGGHLCGVMLTTDWAELGAPKDLLKGGVAMSGMYELYPVMLSARRNYIKISQEELAALSAMRHLDQIACNVIVVFGDKESPEFQRQSNEFAMALAGMGRLTKRIVLAGKTHYDVPEEFNDARSAVSQATLAMMKAEG